MTQCYLSCNLDRKLRIITVEEKEFEPLNPGLRKVSIGVHCRSHSVSEGISELRFHDSLSVHATVQSRSKYL